MWRKQKEAPLRVAVRLPFCATSSFSTSTTSKNSLAAFSPQEVLIVGFAGLPVNAMAARSRVRLAQIVYIEKTPQLTFKEIGIVP